MRRTIASARTSSRRTLKMMNTHFKPHTRLQGAFKAPFFAGDRRRLTQSISTTASRVASRPTLQVQASGRKCELTGKKANNGYTVTFSHIRNKKLQHVNLHCKRVYWPEGKRWVRLRLSTRAIKTLEKKGLQAMARDAGIDLAKLPYNDVSPARVNWLKENSKGYPAQPKKIGKSRRMKNPEKLAASKKRPLQARYLAGSRVILTRDPKYVEEYRG